MKRNEDTLAVLKGTVISRKSFLMEKLRANEHEDDSVPDLWASSREGQVTA